MGVGSWKEDPFVPSSSKDVRTTVEVRLTHELKTGGDRGYLRIATEEAFATHEQFDAIMRLVKEGRADKGTMSLWGFYGTSPSERTTFIRERLLDVGPLRLQAMDESGIDKAVL